MKQNKDDTITMNLRPDDITTIMEIAEEDRRPRAHVMRNMLEDIVSGVLPVEFEAKPKIVRFTAQVNVESAFKAKFDAFRASVGGLSADQIIEQALKVIREQRAARPPKSVDERLEDLKHRHRHSNSPIPDDLDPERETKTAA